MGILIAIIALIVAYKVYTNSQRDRGIYQRSANFSVANFFTPHETYISADSNCAIAVDKDRRLIGLQDSQGQCYYYDEQYIVNSQIVLNEQTYQQKPFLNVWGSYALGKWIGGDKIGEIAAMTTNVKVKKDVNSIKLKVTVNDLTKPSYTVVFLNGSCSKRQQEEALEHAEYWDSMIKVLIHNDRRNFV